MRLEHSFTVPVPVDTAWEAMTDPWRVAPCFPGATLTGVDGDEFSGTVKIRMGPIALTYKGVGRFTSVDAETHRAVIDATGKDSRGNGTASATVTAQLTGSDSGTTVEVTTDLTITGRPAQLGRGLIGDVGGKIVDAFAACLATQLGTPASGGSAGATDSGGPASVASAASVTDGSGNGLVEPGAAEEADVLTAEPQRPPAAADEIDLLDLAGQPVLKRVMPAIAGVLAVLLVLRWLRRRG